MAYPRRYHPERGFQAPETYQELPPEPPRERPKRRQGLKLKPILENLSFLSIAVAYSSLVYLILWILVPLGSHQLKILNSPQENQQDVQEIPEIETLPTVPPAPVSPARG